MKPFVTILLILSLFLVYQPSFCTTSEVAISSPTKVVKRKSKVAVRIKRFVEKNIINRFSIFKGNVSIDEISISKRSFKIIGRLTSPNGTPMDLVGKFCEALDNVKKFGAIIPSMIKKENVEEQNRVKFVITIDGDDKKITEDELQ